MPEKDEKTTTVSIPNSLAEKLNKRIKNTNFSSISEYVTYILRKIIYQIESEEKQREAFSKEEEDKVKERLRNLGYID